MEIKENEFIRTKTGKIDKVINNNYYMSQYIECEKRIVEKENIVKHSFNIIDLIEIGDIVNGYRIDERAEHDVLIHKARGINRSGFMIPVAQYNEEIKTILTHEQYERNCYNVEEEE